MARLVCILLFGLFLLVCGKESLVAQTLGLTSPQEFRRCTEGDNQEFKLKVTHISDKAGFKENSFSLDWGDGREGLQNVAYDVLNAVHTYTKWGVFELKITAVAHSGELKEQFYRVVNLSRPAVGLEEDQTGISCVNALMELTVTNYKENSDATIYRMDFGDGHQESYTQEELIRFGGKIGHKYTQTHCDLGYPAGITVRLTAQNECGYEKSMDSPGHYIIRPPKADFWASSSPGCTGEEIVLSNRSDGGAGKNCAPLNDLIYEWDFGKTGVGEGQEDRKNPHVVYGEKGTYPVTLTIRSDAFSCARDTKTINLDIIESVKAGFDVPLDKGCDLLQDVIFTDRSTGDERTYDWQVKGSGVQGGYRLKTDKRQADARIDFHFGDYVVTQTVSNSCSVAKKDTLIQVSKDPEITRFDSLLPVCPGDIVRMVSSISYNWYNNERRPEWTIEPSSGWEPVAATTLHSEYPQIRFMMPGDYTLTVTLPSAGCGGKKLAATRKLHVYDPTIDVSSMVADKKEMCEGETLTVQGAPVGEVERTVWTVKLAGGETTDIVPRISDDKVEVTIPDFGKYRVIATVYGKGGCTVVVKDFEVTVRRAPEVNLLDFPAYWCPGNEFYPGGWCSLEKNGNETVGIRWEVWLEGKPAGADQVVITGEQTENPKMKFLTFGDYEIRVVVENPAGVCGPLDKLSASRVLHVVNPQITVDIESSGEQLCRGEIMSFSNKTIVEEGVPEYYWSVVPGSPGIDYEFTGGTGTNSAGPEIRFLKSGRYTVHVNVTLYGGCNSEMKSFPVTVMEDPEVVIDPLDTICPGFLVLDESVVHYDWNDGWNGGVEGLRKVEWSLVSKPNGALFTPYESPEWSSLYPRLQLQTPGRYVLQARLVSLADCGLDPVFQQTVEVYDPAVEVRIDPILDGDVQKGPDNTYRILQRKEVNFHNVSSGVGLSYSWSVSPVNGVVLSDASAKEPKITFHEHGTFVVKVHTEGACNKSVPDREFVFRVMGVPALALKPLPDRCDNWEDRVLDLKAYLECDSAGNSDINCNWEITPQSGWSLAGGTTSNDMYMQINFSRNGIYTLKLTAEAPYGGPQTVSGQIRVLKHEVSAKAEFAGEGCTTDEEGGKEITLLNRSEGDSLEYTWRILPEKGWGGDLNGREPTVRFTEQGNYRILLKAANICEQPEVSYDFRAYAKPEVEQLDGPDLGRICMENAVFRGGNYIGEIRENNDAVTARWEISPKGYDFVNGSAGSRKPDIRFLEGDQAFHLTGKYFNRCKDTASVHFDIWVDSLKPVKLRPQDPLCAMSGAVELKAMPVDGVWSVKPGFEGMLEKEGNTFYFNPNRNEDLTVRAYYEYGNGACVSRDSIEINVRQLPGVDAGRDTAYCLNEGLQELVGIEPYNLTTWKGPGIVDEKFFNPRMAGVGRARLEYRYTDPVTSCSNRDSLFVTVKALPDPGFRVASYQCRGTDSLFIPVELGKGNRFQWDFGNGDRLSTEDKAAVYAYPQHGTYQVRMVATSPLQCSDTSDWTPLTVLDPPPTAAFILTDTAGCGPFTTQAAISPEHFAGEYYDLHYLWKYGNGNISTRLEPERQTYLSALQDTAYRLIFQVGNVCGIQTDSATIGVWSGAVADFAMNPEEEGCTPAEVLFINRSTGSGNVYHWAFGDGSTSEEMDPMHVFTTGKSMSVYSIRLEATNRCTPDSTFFERRLKVKPNTIVAGFTKSAKYLCAGDTLYLENHSVDRDPSAALNYSWDFGDGQVAAVWDTCHQYTRPGTYPIVLKVDNGCARREFKDSVTVHVLPVLQLEGDHALCEDVELKLAVSSEEPLKNIVWDFGDGEVLKNGAFEVLHAFDEPGKYEVKVRGEADQIPSCPGTVIKSIEVWPNPRVSILPLDTMACPPFLYRPELVATSYDYFTWDYGDNTALTSEKEHVYTNETDAILSHPIKVYVENNYGCKEEHTGLIRIYNGPKAGWDKEIGYGRPEKVKFINLSENYTQATWYLPYRGVVHSQEDQTVVFPEEGIYPVALAVANSYGCRDSLNMEYRSYQGGLYFPNSFIPHSSNARVNTFNGIGVGLKEYKLEIYDMYGNKVWQTTALKDGVPSEGWDGRNKNGKLLPQGVYMWRAEAVFYSEDVWTGDNNRSGQPQTTQGTVLLLRK